MEQSKIIDTLEMYHGGAEGGEVIALSSDDEVEGGGDSGAEGVEVGPEY